MGEVVQFVRREEPVRRYLEDWRFWRDQRGLGLAALSRLCLARQNVGAALSRLSRQQALAHYVAAFPGVTRRKAAHEVAFAISAYRMHLLSLEAAA